MFFLFLIDSDEYYIHYTITQLIQTISNFYQIEEKHVSQNPGINSTLIGGSIHFEYNMKEEFNKIKAL